MNVADWEAIVHDLHDLDSMDADQPVALRAAERLHHSATVEDVPRLLRLLLDDNFFVREAAAWPLTEIAGASYLPELLHAYQRGLEEGHDNDGFSAALADLAQADPVAVRQTLQTLLPASDESTQRNATWLLQFCVEGA
jgi:hypothetical protein